MYSSDDLKQAERALLNLFDVELATDLEGPSGEGKTRIAKEMALLLGLPYHKFQMHGSRELSDFLGSYREDEEGNLYLSLRPNPVTEDELKTFLMAADLKRLVDEGILKQHNTEAGKFLFETGIFCSDVLDYTLRLKGVDLGAEKTEKLKQSIHYAQPLLEMLTHGGVFNLDEGAVGDKARELLSWFSGIVNGDGFITIEEIPGLSIRLDIHPDFHLMITNNSPEDTSARFELKSEVSSGVHYVYLDKDESPKTLGGIFRHFLNGATEGKEDVVSQMEDISNQAFLNIKELVGKSAAEKNKERYYISKREIRRMAKYLSRRNWDRESDPFYVFYKAARVVYEGMFASREDREVVYNEIAGAMLTLPGVDADTLFKYGQRIQEEVALFYDTSITDEEAWIAWLTHELIEVDETILFISENGARTQDIVRGLSERRSADIVMVDAIPGHTDFEILGGRVPVFGKKSDARVSRFLPGEIAQYLVPHKALKQLKGSKQREVLV